MGCQDCKLESESDTYLPEALRGEFGKALSPSSIKPALSLTWHFLATSCLP